MSQVDWLVHYTTKLKPGEGVASIVTSADTDEVYEGCLKRIVYFDWQHSKCK